jgi:outer membrane protein, multidrug efflux system
MSGRFARNTKCAIALSCAAWLLASAGCATVPNAFPPVEAVVVQQAWQVAAAGEDLPASPDSATNQPWWLQLPDATLREAVRAALESGPDPSIAVARLEQARASLAASRAQAWPEIGIALGGEREATPRRALALPAREESATAVLSGRTANRFRLDVEGRWELDLFGRRALERTAAQSMLNAAERDVEVVRNMLVTEFVTAYADIALVDAQAPLRAEDVRWAGEALAAARRRLQAGLVTLEQVRERDTALEQAKLASASAPLQRVAASARFAALVGRRADELQVVTAPELLDASWTPNAGIPVTILAQRPDVKAAWERLLAAVGTAERARLERFPTLTLTSAAGYASDSLREWIQGDAFGWTTGLRTATPLLDAGRIRSATLLAQAQAAERQAEYRKSVFAAMQDVQVALSELERIDCELQSARNTMTRRVADANSVQRQLLAGRADRLTIADAQRARVAAAAEVARLQHARLVALANLNRALATPV